MPRHLCSCLCTVPAVAQNGQKAILSLKDGTRLGPGYVRETATISKNSAQQGQAQTMSNSIIGIDDDLRETFVNRSRVDAQSVAPINQIFEEIVLPSAAEIPKGATSIGILSVADVTEFTPFGRRTYSINTNKGRLDILQGITHLTPLYARVNSLRGTAAGPWDMRIATTSIPPVRLREILHHELNMDRASERMRIYRFYLQGERYLEARQELLDAIAKFPELEPQKALLPTLNQAMAAQMFREVELRRRSGQPRMVSELLQKFPVDMTGDGTVTETQLRVQEQLDEMKQTVAQLSELAQMLRSQLAELPPADADLVRPVVDQIVNELSYESKGRLNDYARFGADKSIAVDRRLSFAIGGWLLGGGAGLDNFEVAKSIIRVSALVREYLSGAPTARREEILQLLAKEEGGRPEIVGRIIAAMKPPMPCRPRRKKILRACIA